MDEDVREVSRFRPVYRKLTDDESKRLLEMKQTFAMVESFIVTLPASRYRALALTALEESCMWATKELTS